MRSNADHWGCHTLEMHRELTCIWIADSWIIIESWGQGRFAPLVQTDTNFTISGSFGGILNNAVKSTILWTSTMARIKYCYTSGKHRCKAQCCDDVFKQIDAVYQTLPVDVITTCLILMSLPTKSIQWQCVKSYISLLAARTSFNFLSALLCTVKSGQSSWAEQKKKRQKQHGSIQHRRPVFMLCSVEDIFNVTQVRPLLQNTGCFHE